MSDDALTVVGTNGGITEKANGWFEVAVAIPGKQYPVKLSTKKSEIVDAVRELGAGEVGTFSYKETESDRINPHTEKPYINRYLEGVEKGGTVSTASGSSGGGGQSGDVDWDSKERRDFRSRAWAHTLGAFGHTIKVDEDPMLVFARLHSFQQAIYQDIVQELAQGTPAQTQLPVGPGTIPTSRRTMTTISPSESRTPERHDRGHRRPRSSRRSSRGGGRRREAGGSHGSAEQHGISEAFSSRRRSTSRHDQGATEDRLEGSQDETDRHCPPTTGRHRARSEGTHTDQKTEKVERPDGSDEREVHTREVSTIDADRARHGQPRDAGAGRSTSSQS